GCRSWGLVPPRRSSGAGSRILPWPSSRQRRTFSRSPGIHGVRYGRERTRQRGSTIPAENRSLSFVPCEVTPFKPQRYHIRYTHPACSSMRSPGTRVEDRVANTSQLISTAQWYSFVVERKPWTAKRFRVEASGLIRTRRVGQTIRKVVCCCF